MAVPPGQRNPKAYSEKTSAPPVATAGEGAPEEAGVYPFTRGLHPQGYRGRLWTMRQ